MNEIFSEAIGKLRQNKNKLERTLNVKISFRGKIVFVEGKAIDEYLAIQVIEAASMGFTIPESLLLKQEDFVFEKLLIKDLTRKKDLPRIKARLIGTHGKTKHHIEELSDCVVSIHDSEVGIIGHIEDIERAIQAITSIVQGSKQSKVYSYLERERTKNKGKLNEDLGLRIKLEKE